MFATILIPIMLLTPGVQGRDEQILRSFTQSVESYAALHREALESVPRELCGGPEEVELTRSLLDSEIRRLRPDAREGDIFTPEVGTLIRSRVQAAVRDAGWIPPDPETGAGGRPLRRVAEVNAAYTPYFGPHPWSVFRALPLLPEELEYRFVGRDLVLIDVTASLVVDVLREAIGGED
jgi:hypothetical protein